MAKQELVMPQMGESITTGTITKWHKKAGDEVDIDETLLEISTDKVESEIPSPFKGRIMELKYPEGDTIDVGKVIAIIEDDLSVPFTGGGASSSASSTEAPKAQATKPAEKAPAELDTSSKGEPAQPAEHGEEIADDGQRRFYTPLVKAMAKEAGIPLNELSRIKGTGAGGRVNKEDLEGYMASRGGGSAQPAKAAPQAQASAPKAAPAAAGGVAQVGGHGERIEVIPMDNMRKAIARNMVQSKMTSPHVNSVDEIDMTNLVKFREGFKHTFQKQEGFSLTYTHFILYALVQALKEFPMVNASIDGDNIILKKDINLGCAVAVPGNGLVVPNIRNADSLNITGIARAVNTLANKARSKKLTMEDLQGGTFTFTNVGSFGTLLATPVILQPQLGIFAAGVIKKRVMVNDDNSIAIRDMMYGTHTYDHRLVDGELGGRFLASVKQHLEGMDPKSLF